MVLQSARDATEKYTPPGVFDPGDVERLLSYLRVGSDYKTAWQAVGWDAPTAAAFEKQEAAVIDQAHAQFRVLCLNSIMVEGGAAGAKFLLAKHAEEKGDIFGDEKPAGQAKPTGKDEWDNL